MEIIDQTTFSNFSKLLTELKAKPQRILIIHDVDGDGSSSGKIVKEALQRLGINAKYRFAAFDRSNLFGEFMKEFLENRKISVIITTDLNISSTNYQQQKEMLKDKKLIVFDHHEVPTEVEPNVYYFHPTKTFGFPQPSQYCTSKIVYDIFAEFTDILDLKWVACIGIVSDSTYPTWKEFVDDTLKELHLPITKSPFDSKLQEVGTLLYYGLAMDRLHAEKALQTYFEAKSYEEALTKMQEFSVVEQEIQRILNSWKKSVEKYDDVYFIVVDTKYKVNSMLSNKISSEHKSTTIVVASLGKADEGKEQMVSMSLRRQDGKINLPALLKELAGAIPGLSGGGHLQASGAKCPLKEFERFKKLFLEYTKGIVSDKPSGKVTRFNAQNSKQNN